VKNTASRPKMTVSADGKGLVSQSGGLLLTQVLRVTGLDRALSQGLGRYRAPRAVHDPGKIIADVAAAVALGGDCLADIAVLRAQPDVFGPVASDPVVSRLVTALAADAPRALKAIRGTGNSAGAGLDAGRGCGARRGRRPGDRRPGRDDPDRSFGERAGSCHMEADVRPVN
jgi:Transposase DDE domain group 1